MKTVEAVCKELKALDGVVGAFVLQQSQCLASNLPAQYDSKRLAQVATTIARLSQISSKAGYDGISTAFHWRRGSLLTWPLEREALLGLLTSPTAVREAIELGASVAIEDLASILSGEPDTQASESAPTAEPSLPPESVQDEQGIDSRLQNIERLLVEELGPSGKSLLERCRNKVPRTNASTSKWLLGLRAAILGEICDPGARVTIGTSVYWAESD